MIKLGCIICFFGFFSLLPSFCMSLNIYIQSSIRMDGLMIFQLAFAVVDAYGFIQPIIIRKHIFTKNEYFLHSQCKNKVTTDSVFKDIIFHVVNKLMNIKKTKFKLQKYFFFINNTNYLFHTPSAYDLCATDQVHLSAYTQMTNLPLPVNISSQALHAIFEHYKYDFFFIFSSFYEFYEFLF